MAEKDLNYSTTAEIKVPDKLIDQVIGQERAVELVKKAAKQRRNVLLIGEPGTGKSMLAKGMADIMPVDKLDDILIYPNKIDSHTPIVKVLPGGEGKKIVEKMTLDEKAQKDSMRFVSLILPLGWFILSVVAWQMAWISDVIFAAALIVGSFFVVASALSGQIRMPLKVVTPKLLIDNSKKNKAPFVDGTGSKAGALFGDVKHDPLQSGGLGTPPHLRVIPGMIHRANKGVLFLDEIATLSPKSQQDLLTAMQEKKASVTGQSELSSGAMVRTEPVPCDFVLVAAGNYESLQHLHPAIRSRIRGYGYEVYMNVDMDDTPDNRNKIVRFVAQEVKNDGKIPHFNNEAVEFIIFEARRRANSKKKLSLKFRELGGLIRAAGDIAVEKGKKIVDMEDMMEAKKSAKTLEEQMIGKYINRIKDYSVFSTKGREVGRVNGLAVLSDGETGTIISIEADVAPAQSKSEGKIYATGKLGEIAKEAVLNVSSIIKKVSNTDLSSHDIHIQFLQSYSGVEGDSASIAITTAVISAIEGIPVRQDIAMTGSLSVKGKVMPVGGVTAKVKAALDAGFRTVIVPKQNVEDIVLTEEDKKKVRIISVNNLHDVLSQVFEDGKQMDVFLKKLKKELE
ncbi:MAG: ATP-dependent protease LonB [Candidatus ainarchaeum sp.]|nr:ATP-dependent protease LonB [Candidatus ainarchaeum sp.]